MENHKIMSETSLQTLMIYLDRKKDGRKIWPLFLFLGWSHGSLGEVGLQIVYYLTGGGLGIWAIIRLFTLNKAIKSFNRNLADELGVNKEDYSKLGL